MNVSEAARAGLLATGALFFVGWVVSVLRKDASVIDPLWGPAFVVIAWVERGVMQAATPRAWLVCGLVTAWGVRLAIHLAWRNRGRGEDPRYAAMRARSPRTFPWTSLVTVFALQAVLAWFIALPIHAALRPLPPFALGAWDAAGVALWLAGFAFEAIGDAQLVRFRSNPANRGRVMDRGLWAWTRHPNYFGETCMAWGLGLIALATPGGAWALAGPALLTALLLRVSGVTLLERHMATRPGWAAYVHRTSPFVPWPPRRSR